MYTSRTTRIAGFFCLAGAIVQLIYGLLAVWVPYAPDTYYGWDEALWLAATLGMVGGVLGLLILDLGRPRWLAVGSGTLVILALLARSLASILIIFQADWNVINLIPLTVLIVLLGMFVLGIAVLRGKQLTGWRAWTPFIISISGFLVSAVFSFNLYLHFILLGLWGISWLLVGYVIVMCASAQTPSRIKNPAAV